MEDECLIIIVSISVTFGHGLNIINYKSFLLIWWQKLDKQMFLNVNSVKSEGNRKTINHICRKKNLKQITGALNTRQKT